MPAADMHPDGSLEGGGRKAAPLVFTPGQYCRNCGRERFQGIIEQYLEQRREAVIDETGLSSIRRIGGAALRQTPLVLLAYISYTTKAPLWLALLLAALYEIAVFATRFIRRIGEKSWAQIGPSLKQ